MALGTVLYAEHDEFDMDLLHRAWKKGGLLHPLEVVTDGEQVMTYLSTAVQAGRQMPSLVLLDLRLPKQTGLQVLEWIREQPPPIRTVRVVLLTSSNNPSDIQRAQALGVEGYIVKGIGRHDHALHETVAVLKGILGKP